MGNSIVNLGAAFCSDGKISRREVDRLVTLFDWSLSPTLDDWRNLQRIERLSVAASLAVLRGA